MNTHIAKSDNITYVDFQGSNFSNPCYIKIKDDQITATYNRKTAGLITAGIDLGRDTRKAVNQKRLNGNKFEVESLNFDSTMDAVKYLTGFHYNGSLADNSTIL